MTILVSACLLACPCRYDGQAKADAAVLALAREGVTLIPVCPEQLGGLPTPRAGAEIQPSGRVLTSDGRDVTRQYQSGAQSALRIAILLGCRTAILKARSPSCGCGRVYDGTFSRTLTDGWGCAADALRSAGVRVMTEEELSSDGGPLPRSAKERL